MRLYHVTWTRLLRRIQGGKLKPSYTEMTYETDLHSTGIPRGLGCLG